MSLLHLTVADKPHPGLDLLLDSSARTGIQTRVLGLGSTEEVGHGKGFGFKLRTIKAELALIPPLQLVMFTDAYDVLLQKSDSLQELIVYLQANPGVVVFAAEKAKWPDAREFYPVPLRMPFPYLNSGVYAGRAMDILQLLEAPFDSKTDDQRYFVKQYLNPGKVRIVLDHDARYFSCFYGLTTENVKTFGAGLGLEVVFPSGKTKPFAIHLNNGGVRFRWYSSAVRAILGDVQNEKVREVVWRSVVGPFYAYRNLIALVLLLVCLAVYWICK